MMTLYCIPHAAASAMNYYAWKPLLPPEIRLAPLDLPGHGARSQLPLLEDMEAVAEDLLACMDDPPEHYMIFGHSLGSWAAHALYHRIRQAGRPLPKALFFSGRRSPFVSDARECLDNLDDAACLAILQRFGGTSDALLQSEALRAHTFALLRADSRLLSGYRPPAGREAIQCDVLVLSGAQDDTISSAGLLAWRPLCGAGFQVHILPGNHFFPFTSAQRVVRIIEDVASPYCQE